MTTSGTSGWRVWIAAQVASSAATTGEDSIRPAVRVVFVALVVLFGSRSGGVHGFLRSMGLRRRGRLLPPPP